MASFREEKLNRLYTRLQLKGIGGTSQVYSAKSRTTRKTVCLKKFSKFMSKDKIFREVSILSTISHDNIVGFIDGFVSDDTCFLVQEYIDGMTLAQQIARRTKLWDEAAFCYVAISMIDALNYLHFHGIIHGDIKACNVLVTKEGGIKLADFGSSCRINEDRRDSIQGSFLYMAPELIISRFQNLSNDVWSFGITLLEVVEGRPPYVDELPENVVRRIVSGPSPCLEKVGSLANLSENMLHFLSICLKKNPKQRATMMELKAHSFVSADLNVLRKHFAKLVSKNKWSCFIY